MIDLIIFLSSISSIISVISIKKLTLAHLRNAEHQRFVDDADKIYDKYQLELQLMSPFYAEFKRLKEEEAKSMTVERNNAKVKEKGRAERNRDKLHSKLFNSVKYITYDESDPLFEAAQRVMTVIKSVGNPKHLAENAESSMLINLGVKLEPYRADLEALGVQVHLDKLLDANNEFIQLEMECRDIVTARSLANTLSMVAVRREIDAVHRTIVAGFNMQIKLKGEEDYRTFVADLNTLIDRYESLLAQRKTRSSNSSKDEEN